MGLAGTYIGSIVSMFGAGLTLKGMNDYGASKSPKEDYAAGSTTMLGAGLGVLGDVATGAAMGSIIPGIGNVAGAIGGGIVG